MNRVIICGNLTRDPRYFKAEGEDSQARAHFAVAVDRSPGKEDSKVDYPEFTAYGNTAVIVNKHLAKGSKVLIEGAVRTFVKDDRGENRSQTTFVVQNLTILSWVKDGESTEDESEALAAVA